MVGLIGVVFGPMYPIAIHQASRILPRHIYLGAVGWIAGFGQAGSAIIPFITGAIAQKHGIKSLNPVSVSHFLHLSTMDAHSIYYSVVAMMGVMAAIFWFVPDAPVKGGSDSDLAEEPSEEVKEKA